ncbi:MAG: hypothetical protein I3273_07655 [Candidatus Moeniiplasma glomeromycotorum]|nr:hypothetical protein [Candidatus Moeniiplasma glomeromycotorum]MCE8168113.1 hypothetical protein [Candidatus Moeniiplasma glomeromycotorum]MCE8169955.1 hypothetical protein [Candidatus Moeniiplasma glomeromycotorum]
MINWKKKEWFWEIWAPFLFAYWVDKVTYLPYHSQFFSVIGFSLLLNDNWIWVGQCQQFNNISFSLLLNDNWIWVL